MQLQNVGYVDVLRARGELKAYRLEHMTKFKCLTTLNVPHVITTESHGCINYNMTGSVLSVSAVEPPMNLVLDQLCISPTYSYAAVSGNSQNDVQLKMVPRVALCV